MKSVNKSKPGKSVSSDSESKTTASGSVTKVIVSSSENVDESKTHVDQHVHENKSSKLRRSTGKSSQDYGAMIVALNNTMLSQMELMKEHMTKQTELLKDMKRIQIEMQEKMEVIQGDIKVIKHDLHDSDGSVAKLFAPIQFDLSSPEGSVAKMFASIQFDLGNPDGHLAKMLKESEERSSKERKESETRSSKECKESEDRIIQAIKAPIENSRKSTDKMSSNNKFIYLKVAAFIFFMLLLLFIHAESVVYRVNGTWP